MKRFLLSALALSLLLSSTPSFAGDWPWWRGMDRTGIAESGQNPPTEFGPDKNVKWQVEVPGRSHGSPIVCGEKVFLAAAEEDSQLQSVICFDRATGKQQWKTVVHKDGMQQKSNKKATWASGSPACDGERIFVNFVSGDAAYTTALDLDGKQIWQKKICDYKIHQGYGSSPAIWKNLVIVSADNKLGGAVCAFDRVSGEEVWRVGRAEMPNYPSPIILEAAGKEQLFLTGTEKVSSFDPMTGKVNWEIDGATTECVTTTVTDGTHIYSSGGYPKNHIAAIVADGSGKVAWETNDRVYVPSMLVSDGNLFAVMDSGVAICVDAASGKEKWKARLGGNFSSSPVMVNDLIYAANEAGTLYVYKASSEGLEVVSENKVGDEVFATPVICGGNVYLRVVFYDGEKRSEKLFCYGE